MDTSSTLLGIGLLLAFIAPVGYLIIDQSRRAKAGQKNLFTAASHLNLEISKFEILSSLYLGLDEIREKLLVVTPEKKNKPDVIALSDCKIQLIKKYQDDNPAASIDEVREIFLLVKGRDSEKNLYFFRSGADPVTESAVRLQKAVEWENILLKFQK